MSTLKEKAEEILAEKEAKILPENIKHGVTIFGITGTYTGDEPQPVWEEVQRGIVCNVDPDNQDNELYCDIYTNTGGGNVLSKVMFTASSFDSDERFVNIYTDVDNCWSSQEDMSELYPISTIIATLYAGLSSGYIYSNVDANELVDGINQYITYDWAGENWQQAGERNFEDPHGDNSMEIIGYENASSANVTGKLNITTSFTEENRMCDISLGYSCEWYWDIDLTDPITDNIVTVGMGDAYDIYTNSEHTSISEFIGSLTNDNITWHTETPEE